jgi:hypothetical protein
MGGFLEKNNSSQNLAYLLNAARRGCYMNIKISCVIAFEGPTPGQIERIQSVAKGYQCRTIETPNTLRVMFDDHDKYQTFLEYAGQLITECEEHRLKLDYFN